MIPLFLFLLAVGAIYAGTIEAAFSALMKLSLRLVVERDARDRLGRYLDEPVRLFLPVRLLLGIIFALTTVLLATLTGARTWQSFAGLLVAIAAFVLLTEHFIPLLIVRRDPERVLEVLLPSFDAVARALSPLSTALVNLTRERRRDGGEHGEEPGGEAAAAQEAPQEQEPALSESEERQLLRSIVDFGDTRVREVMTPRPDIVAVPADATVAELRELFREQEYSRLPVFTENLDNIVGVVFVKDLLHHEEVGPQDSIASLVRAATFVPETKRVADLLKEFQRGQVQIAIVVDEYGGTAGLVTLEDLLEELVGEIRDEYDVESEPVVDEGNGVFTFSAKVSIEELAQRLGIHIEPQGFETVGGYLLTLLGRVPAVGESFEIEGIAVEVLEAERRRIHKVRVRRLPQPETVEAEGRG
ncbi:MAG TPA: hemolysin family protein [Vicinamibacterales bacterium]|nr:hemolysin family protein [Vicinamibacterales bacterium]